MCFDEGTTTYTFSARVYIHGISTRVSAMVSLQFVYKSIRITRADGKSRSSGVNFLERRCRRGPRIFCRGHLPSRSSVIFANASEKVAEGDSVNGSFREKFHWIRTRNRSRQTSPLFFSLSWYVSSLSLYREVLKCYQLPRYISSRSITATLNLSCGKREIPASHDSLSISRFLRYRSPCLCAFLSSSQHSWIYDANTGIRITSRTNNWSLLEN